MQFFQDNFLDEKYFFYKHDSGLRIYFCPKKEFKSYFAIIGTKYGSVNKNFKLNSRIIETPAGIAHFLEHKLFECKTGDAFALFNKTGASANAYTSYDKTAYLFSCTDNLKKSLKILFDFIQEPYFTQKSILKERGIIEQEIKMYSDSPDWQVTLNLLQSIYKNHPVRDDIAGSVESISYITPDLLNKCYEAFYDFSNMTFCLVGNFEPDDIIEFINKNITKKATNNHVETIFPDEPDCICKNNISQKMEILNPLFAIGFKHKALNSRMSCQDAIILELISKTLILKSGNLYNKLLDKNLITTNNFYHEFFEGPFYASSIFSGESKNPDEVAKIIINEINNICQNGFNKQEFERAKKCYYAEAVSIFNRVSSIGNNILDLDFAGYNIFELINNIKNINFEIFNSKINKYFNINKSVVSKIIS